MKLALSFAVALATAGAASARGAEAPVSTYRAVYQVEYKGKPLGSSEFSVSHDAERGIYRFESRTLAKGMLKLVTPHPVIERSEFRLVSGGLQPLEFWYEDGSRKGEDNLHVVFDWEKGRAVTEGESGRHELALTPGVLDRGTLQVALMRDLARADATRAYSVADGDAVKIYEYVANGEAAIATGRGTFQTLAFTQQREGSSRSTWIWVAAELDYLPVRIEQRRNGEVQTAFTLESVEGLGE